MSALVVHLTATLEFASLAELEAGFADRVSTAAVFLTDARIVDDASGDASATSPPPGDPGVPGPATGGLGRLLPGTRVHVVVTTGTGERALDFEGVVAWCTGADPGPPQGREAGAGILIDRHLDAESCGRAERMARRVDAGLRARSPGTRMLPLRLTRPLPPGPVRPARRAAARAEAPDDPATKAGGATTLELPADGPATVDVPHAFEARSTDIDLRNALDAHDLTHAEREVHASQAASRAASPSLADSPDLAPKTSTSDPAVAFAPLSVSEVTAFEPLADASAEGAAPVEIVPVEAQQQGPPRRSHPFAQARDLTQDVRKPAHQDTLRAMTGPPDATADAGRADSTIDHAASFEAPPPAEDVLPTGPQHLAAQAILTERVLAVALDDITGEADQFTLPSVEAEEVEGLEVIDHAPPPRRSRPRAPLRVLPKGPPPRSLPTPSAFPELAPASEASIGVAFMLSGRTRAADDVPRVLERFAWPAGGTKRRGTLDDARDTGEEALEDAISASPWLSRDASAPGRRPRPADGAEGKMAVWDLARAVDDAVTLAAGDELEAFEFASRHAGPTGADEGSVGAEVPEVRDVVPISAAHSDALAGKVSSAGSSTGSSTGSSAGPSARSSARSSAGARDEPASSRRSDPPDARRNVATADRSDDVADVSDEDVFASGAPPPRRSGMSLPGRSDDDGLPLHRRPLSHQGPDGWDFDALFENELEPAEPDAHDEDETLPQMAAPYPRVAPRDRRVEIAEDDQDESGMNFALSEDTAAHHSENGDIAGGTHHDTADAETERTLHRPPTRASPEARSRFETLQRRLGGGPQES